MANHHRLCDFRRDSGNFLSVDENFIERGGVQIFQSVLAILLDIVLNPADIHEGRTTFQKIKKNSSAKFLTEVFFYLPSGLSRFMWKVPVSTSFL